MKKTTKKLCALMAAFCATACVSVGGMFAFSQIASANAAETLEGDFTNNGQFSVSQYGTNTLEYVNAANLGVGEGAVLKVNVNGAGSAYVTVDFSAFHIAAADVESIVVKIYSPEYSASDSFRVSNVDLTAGWWQNDASDMSAWCDVTLNSAVMAGLTDANGYLASATMGARVHGSATAYYIDSITVNMKNAQETTKVNFNTIHAEWNNYAYDNSSCTFIQFNGGIGGNGDLDADFSDLYAKMTLNGAAVDTSNFSFYCPNWIGASDGIVMRVATNPEVGSVLVLPKGAKFDIGGEDTNVYEIEKDVQLKFNGTAWEVYVGVNYNPDFLSIGELNHVYSEGLDAYGVSLVYDTIGFEVEGMHTALGFSGFSLNGEEIGVALWGENQVLLWLAASKCVNDYRGYSHPTIVLAEGAKVTNTAGEEFTLGGVTLYLVNGAWTTTQPDGYHVEEKKAVFADFTIDGVGATQNHVHNGAFYQLTLDFEYSALEFNKHASAVSGMTFNGVPMTCGGAPSGDSIMVITLGNGLWVHYTDAQAAAGYKGYSHPTIQFENGATVTDANGKTVTYEALTLYLVNGAWTTEQPADYEIVEPAKNTTFVAIGKTAEVNNSNTITLYFDDNNDWTDAAGTLANKVLLDGVSLSSIGGTVTKGERAITLAWTGEYAKLTIAENATFAGQNIPQMTLYLNDGAWSFVDGSREATVSCSGVASGAWDNVERETGYSSNVFKFSANFAASADKTNQAASIAYPVATGIKINGVTLYELYLQDNKTTVSFEHGYGYLYFMVAKEYLVAEEGEYTELTIEEGTVFMDQVLPACRYILYDGHWVNADSFDPNPFPYNGVAPGWNNVIHSGVSNTILMFGEYGVNFLGPDNGSASHADPANLANPELKAPIATALTIDGKPISELFLQDNRVQVSYAHGYNYFHIAIPEYMLSKDGYGCVTLHIADKTVFRGCVLPEVTLYLYEGEWTNIKPDVVEGEDAEYTTLTDMFGEATKELSGVASAESTIAASDSVVYSFLLKNDSADNTVIFSTHYTTDFDGIKVVFIGDSSTASERVLLFVNGQEIASASYLWTADEWFAVRIAVDVAETLSVSVAIDGIYLMRATDLAKDLLGTKIGIHNEQGNNTLADYRAGDIKKPILYWQGKDVYRYEANAEKPADSVFYSVIDIMDNKDGAVDESAVQVLWQDGAVTDGKLNVGVWTVTFVVSDAAGNTVQYAVTVIVEDTTKVTVTFDGVETETIYHIGDLLVEPNAPVRDGYTFEGWYVNGVKWDFVNDVLAGDLALTAKFVRVETTYTVVITSEGLTENYTYTFELVSGATIDESLFARDGYTYEFYLGDTEVEEIVVTSSASYKVVYTEVEDKPTDSEDSSDSTGEEDIAGDTQSGEESGCGGCSGVVSFGGVGLTMLIASAALMMKKKKED